MKKITSILSVCLIFILFQTSCKRSPVEDIRINVNTDLYNSPILLRFVNANQNSTAKPDNFIVKITGKDASFIVTSEGKTTFNAMGGLLTLAVNSKTIATAANPIKFTISTQIAGFMPVIRDIIVTSNEPLQTTISLLELSNPIAGVSIVSNQVNLSNGVFDNTYVITTPTRNEMKESTKLQIPAGTKILDKNGNVISGSSISTDVTFFGTGTDESLKTFPGGLSPQNVIGKDGAVITGGINFVTAGMLSINMTSNGSEVKSFSNPIAATVELNPSQDNFATGLPIKAGDSIPVWSMDETTGQWKYESQAIVNSVAGKLVANFAITHLSGWNLDWGWSMFGNYNSCSSSLQVKTLTTAQGGNYEITLKTPSGNYLGALHGTSIYNGFIANFTSTPNIANAKIVVSDNNTGSIVGETPLFNPCTKGSIDVVVTGPPTPDYVNVNVTVQGICKNKQVNANIGAWFYLYIPNNNFWFQGFYTQPGGSTNLRLENNKTYVLFTYYDGKYYSVNIPLSKTNFIMPSVSGLSGTASYNPNTNTLTVNGVFEVNC